MLILTSGLIALVLLMLVLKLSQRLTLRLRVLAGVSVSRPASKSCPHLGLAADPFTHGERPSDDHRCYLWMQRDRIDLVHQKGFCLTTAHHKCPWLMVRNPQAAAPLHRRLPQLPRQAWGGLVAAFSAIGTIFSRLRPARSAASADGWTQPAVATARSSGRKRQRLGGSPRQFAPGRAFSAIGTALSSVAGKIAKAQQGALAGARAAAPHVGRTSSAAGAKALFAAVWTGRMAASLAVLLARGLWWLVLHLTQLLARSAVLLARGIRWLAPRAGRALVAGVRLMAGGARSASAAMAARRQAAREAQAAKAAAAVVSASAAAEPAGPAVASATLAEEPGMGELVGAGAAPASGLADMWASAAATAGVDAGEKMTAPVVPASVAKLEELLAEGLATLDRGQETLAYHMFVTATEAKAPRDGGEQYVDLMKRAWFWRAKTAETVEDLVFSLEQALRFDPQNLQMQAHLAWARQRLEREQKLVPAGEEAAPATSHQTRDPRPETRNPSWWTAIGESVRVVGGLLALALAALWATTGVLPALSRLLTQLPVADQALLQRLVLTINATALPGQGHLPIPVMNYDLGLSLPFVLAFLFVFTARGLMDGDPWARTSSLIVAAAGAWLCAACVTNREAGQLGLALCIGIIVAAIAGRFHSPKVLSPVAGRY